MSVSYIRIGLIVGVLFILGLFLFALNIWWTERRRVQKMPRVPMNICDTHGTYPASAALTINVPQENKPDLVVDVCPICYAEKYKVLGMR